MKLDDLKFENAKRYLIKNRPTEKIKNIYTRRNSWSHSNPLLEIMRVNIGLHNDLAKKCYNQWYYSGKLEYEKVTDFLIAGKIPDDAQDDLKSNYAYDKLSEFERPLIDVMNTSPLLRKTALQELKRHMVYHAMDQVGEMMYRDNYYNIQKKDIMKPMKSAIKFDKALRREFG